MVVENRTKKIVVGTIVVLVLIAIVYYSNFQSSEDFLVSTILIKLNIPFEGESSFDVKITNQKDYSQDFNVFFNVFEGIGSISNNNFQISSGESKNVKITFKNTRRESGVLFGYLIVETNTKTKKIPIILSIERENSNAFTIIHEDILRYDEVAPGEKFGIGVKIFHLGSKDSQGIKVTYSINDFEGNIVFSEDENLVVTEKFELNKIVNLPEDIEPGDYVFITIIEFEGIQSGTGSLFEVVKKNNFESFGGTYFIIIVAIIVLAILVLFFYFMKTNNDLLRELKRNQNTELKRNTKLISISRTELSKLKNNNERKNKIKKLEKSKKRLLTRLKTKQKNQRTVFRKLNKKTNKKTSKEHIRSKIKNKLKNWEKEGYEMVETEKEIRKLSNKRLSNKIIDWKKQGYDTRVFEK